MSSSYPDRVTVHYIGSGAEQNDPYWTIFAPDLHLCGDKCQEHLLIMNAREDTP